jgi:hypothetical protein
MLPALWRYQKEYLKWFDDIKLDSVVFKDLGRYARPLTILPSMSESQKKTMMKCLLHTELLKKLRRHQPIRNKKTK